MRSAYSRILKDEKRARDQMERTLTALKGNSGGVCELMKDRDSVAEDAHQCYYCTDFAYMSVI